MSEQGNCYCFGCDPNFALVNDFKHHTCIEYKPTKDFPMIIIDETTGLTISENEDGLMIAGK
jgi:hypothetical protein